MLSIVIIIILVAVVIGCVGFVIFRSGQFHEEIQRLTDENNQLTKLNEEFRNKGSQLFTENQRLTKLNDEFRTKGQQLFAENQRLAKWKSIINAEDKANEILAEAIGQAGSILSNTKQEAELITSSANDILTRATQQSESMTADAKQDAERFTRIANAMRNKIEGYGIEYLVPGISLLDDLADDFGHEQAGQNFKAARESTKQLFKSGLAGECDYVESNRRQTAIAFVADAFNGKVDDILSRVRHDNYGKLSQEVRDSAILVGRNGEAFRNARITPEYVDSRLAELKWATVLHELKFKEREEQRAIREQMREEEKVRKEIEKAKKDAEKQEDIARKAYEEAMARFEAMSAAERATHAKELEEMQERLRLAEEKKRTISMAEQTRVGHVYVISNVGSFGEGVYKVGMTRRLEPQERVDELGDASVPFPFDVHAMIRSNNAPELETKLHHVFLLNQVNKTNPRKEFFRADLSEIRDAVEKLGGQTHWTMVAEAEQYRETLRMEERLTTDTAYRQEWESRQLRLEQLVTADDVS
ncbi:MAG: DUF4041 domain-containing protein [Thermoguttaceae bacterium]